MLPELTQSLGFLGGWASSESGCTLVCFPGCCLFIVWYTGLCTGVLLGCVFIVHYIVSIRGY